jgi:D-hexose-6-phosphate mutarotase
MTVTKLSVQNKLEALELQFGENRCTLTLQGAHLISFIKSGVEQLWMSPKCIIETGKPIRGGVPVCWPWFGAHATEANYPAHGFARTALWSVESEKCSTEFTQVVLKLENRSSNPLFPFDCSVRLQVTLRDSLELSLITENEGSEVFPLSQALHTYFPISDLSSARIEGLNGCRYADKLLDYAESVESRELVSLEEPSDRVYFDSSESLKLIDGKTTRTIHKQNSNTTVVWNPGFNTAEKMTDIGSENYRNFLCIEAANAMSDVRLIEPGESFTLIQRF